jgi:hypothetical protein
MPSRSDPNRDLLLRVATRLGTFSDECLFVGGTTVGLLLSDPGAPTPRPTKDVATSISWWRPVPTPTI